MKYQSTKSKLGEVKYRSKIVNQQLGKEKIFPNELTSQEFTKIMRERLLQSQIDFGQLDKSLHSLSPYLEIGAENALRSAQLENIFNSQGFATDISIYSLAKAKEFAKNFKYKKVPKTICCDANNLPFKSNSFPFIFVYESLHHFPDPKPVLSEIERVLSPGGTCLIGSEPVKAKLQLVFWRRPNKLRLWEKALKVILILPFISHIGKTETELGILEESFSENTWQSAFSVFDKVEAEIAAYPFGPTQSFTKSDKPKWLNPNPVMKIALALGGGIKALGFKKGQYQPSSKSPNEFLICANCRKKDKREIGLVKVKTSLNCPKCHTIYSKYQGVLVLLEDNLKKAILK